MDTNCTCHMVFSQRWIRLESTSGSKRWFRVRISRVYSYTTFIMHAAGVCWQWWSCLNARQCDHLCCVETRVRRWAGPHVCRHVRSTRCRGRVAAVLCTVYCTVCCVQHCTAGGVTSRHCHGLPGSATLPHQGHRPAASRSGRAGPHSLPSWSLGWNCTTF